MRHSIFKGKNELKYLFSENLSVSFFQLQGKQDEYLFIYLHFQGSFFIHREYKKCLCISLQILATH